LRPGSGANLIRFREFSVNPLGIPAKAGSARRQREDG
jgi:hypothetical protein